MERGPITIHFDYVMDVTNKAEPFVIRVEQKSGGALDVTRSVVNLEQV